MERVDIYLLDTSVSESGTRKQRVRGWHPIRDCIGASTSRSLLTDDFVYLYYGWNRLIFKSRLGEGASDKARF